jgi:hypothetical protein
MGKSGSENEALKVTSHERVICYVPVTILPLALMAGKWKVPKNKHRCTTQNTEYSARIRIKHLLWLWKLRKLVRLQKVSLFVG